MAYLHCGRCGLQIKIQAPYMCIENCPRCLARSATVAPLVQRSKWISPAVGWGIANPECRDDGTRDRA